MIQRGVRLCDRSHKVREFSARYITVVKPLRPLLLDQNPEEWDLGDGPDYRRKQVAEWIYAKRANSIAEMTNLPAPLRQQLEDGLRLHRAEAGQAPGLARHDAEIPLGIALRRLHRERAHSRLARSFRRTLRPVHALPLDPGRLRLRLQVLRQRAGGLEAEPHRRGDRRANHRDGTRHEDADQQSRLHGHGRTAGQLRESDEGAQHHQRAVGRRHRRAAHHRLHQRTRAANSRTGRSAAANPAGAFAARRDRRGAPADHAGEPQVSARRAARRLRRLPGEKAEDDDARIYSDRRRERFASSRRRRWPSTRAVFTPRST